MFDRKSRVLRANTSFPLAIIPLMTLLCSFCMLFSCPLVKAEEEVIPAEALPDGAPPLPSPRDRSAGLLILPDALGKYESLFERPLSDWIKAKKVVFRATRSLDHLWKLNDAWEKASQSVEPRFRLTKDLGIERTEANTGTDSSEAIGLPFGKRDAINAENDPKLKAVKILWNTIFVQRMNEELRYTFEMAWSGSQIVRRRAETMYYQRSFLRLEPEQPFLSQWALRFLSPTSMQNYSLLSWQFRDETPSRFWIFSPPIQRMRELLPANRSDGVLGSSISADDLMVWSADPRKYAVQVLSEKTIFVLFPSLKPYPLVQQAADALVPNVGEAAASVPAASVPAATPSGAPAGLPAAATATPKPPSSTAISSLAVSGLKERPLIGGSTAAVWNYDSKQFPQLSPWLPTSVTAVPRKVWLLELVPKDPFYEGGREILFIDQEMMLPVMKITFDRIGELQKTMVGGWGLAERKDRSVVFPFFAFQFSVEQGEAPVTTLTTTSVRKFASKESNGLKTLRTLLQPESYGKPREPAAGAKGASGEKAPLTPADEHSLAID